jgi:hypothetical protein
VSTRAGKHFQRDVTRGVEGMVSTSTKQLEVATSRGVQEVRNGRAGSWKSVCESRDAIWCCEVADGARAG